MRQAMIREAARAIMVVVEQAHPDFLKEEIHSTDWEGLTVDEVLTIALNDLNDVIDMLY